jgi:acetyltransferase-like isoleucine patch superfamily enzyme
MHLLYYKIKYRKINFNGIKLNGFPYFRFNGTVKFGSNLVFNSSITSIWLGFNHPCVIDVSKDAYLKIGDNCGFSAISIRCKKSIIIGDFVQIGFNTTISDTDSHPIDYQQRRITIDGEQMDTVVIGDDAWIGNDVIILKGVTVGERSIVGAGSVVTKNIPPDEIWAGNPAKFIRKITNNE